jgi:hypothetical protein
MALHLAVPRSTGKTKMEGADKDVIALLLDQGGVTGGLWATRKQNSDVLEIL